MPTLERPSLQVQPDHISGRAKTSSAENDVFCHYAPVSVLDIALSAHGLQYAYVNDPTMGIVYCEAFVCIGHCHDGGRAGSYGRIIECTCWFVGHRYAYLVCRITTGESIGGLTADIYGFPAGP